MKDENHVGKIKDLDVPGETAPKRGFEPSAAGVYAEPTAEKRLGIGPRPFMSHSGPQAGDSGIERGQFSTRYANLDTGPSRKGSNGPGGGGR